MTPFMLLDLVDRARDIAIVVTDADLDAPGPTIRFVNDAFVSMAGRPREALVGASPRILQGRHTDPRRVAALGAALRSGQPCRSVLVNYRGDGEPYLCAVEIHPVREETGRLCAFAAFETEVVRRRGRPTLAPFGRFNRLVQSSRFPSESFRDCRF